MNRYIVIAVFFGLSCVMGVSAADGEYVFGVATVQAKDNKSDDTSSKDDKSSDSKSSDEKKVTVCHAPPGNPDNAQTISVAESAVSAHLAHGDTLGECPGTASCVCPPGISACVCPDGSPGQPGPAASTPTPGSQRGVHGQ